MQQRASQVIAADGLSTTPFPFVFDRPSVWAARRGALRIFFCLVSSHGPFGRAAGRRAEVCAEDARVAQRGGVQMIESLHSLTVWREKKKKVYVFAIIINQRHCIRGTYLGFCFFVVFDRDFVPVEIFVVFFFVSDTFSRIEF